MTHPRHGPFRFHFIAGVEDARDVKPHLKREQGWLPNACKKTRGGCTKKRVKRRKG